MSIYPAAHVDLLPEAKTQARITPRLVILHTNGGSRTSTPAQLRSFLGGTSDGGVESHLDIGLDGAVWQFMPFDVRADANVAANRFQVSGDPTWYGAISIETQDHGYLQGPIDADPWTPEQCDSIVEFLRWANGELGIPLVRVTAPNGMGVAAHRDFPQWSGSAHSCPGKARAAQVDELISRAADQGEPPLDLPPLVPSPILDVEEDMAWYFKTSKTGEAVFCQGSDRRVRKVSGFEGFVAESVDPGWANKRIDVPDDVAAWLNSLS